MDRSVVFVLLDVVVVFVVVAVFFVVVIDVHDYLLKHLLADIPISDGG